MRTPAFLRALTLLLACGFAGLGCQFVSGLTVLQVIDGADGGDGEGCTRTSGCAEDEFCESHNSQCLACGIFPPEAACKAGAGSCDSCNGDNVCIAACEATDECTSNRQLDASNGPVRLECRDRCNDITVGCLGPYPCEITCDSGGCNNLVFNCGADGPCKLTCTGDGCPVAKMNCGDNACEARVPSGSSAVITQVCNGSCGCEKTESP